MRLRPLELIHFAGLVCLLALVVVGIATNKLPDWRSAALCLAGLAVLLSVITLLSQKENEQSGWLRLVVNLYPLATIPAIYETLGFLIPFVGGPNRDALLAALDHKLFGTDPTVWLERVAVPALTNLFYLAYTTYYVASPILGIMLWRSNRSRAREFVFSLCLVFFILYVGYCLLPAKGPSVALAAKQTTVLEVTPLTRHISQTIHKLQFNKNDAFPSGHAMITVFCLLFSWNHERRFFKIGLIPGSLLIGATVYCRYHYVVDVIAGIFLAVCAIPLTRRCYEWLYRYTGNKESDDPQG